MPVQIVMRHSIIVLIWRSTNTLMDLITVNVNYCAMSLFVYLLTLLFYFCFHTGPFRCLKCSSSFRDKVSLKKHQMLRHQHSTKRASKDLVQVERCPICSKRYAHRTNLHRHMKQAHRQVNIRETSLSLCINRSNLFQKLPKGNYTSVIHATTPVRSEVIKHFHHNQPFSYPSFLI